MSKTKHWIDYRKSELLKLKEKPRDEYRSYYSILLVNTKMEHDSGYNYFAVVGCSAEGMPEEIIGYMDFFCKSYDKDSLLKAFSIDCSMHGVFRLYNFMGENHKLKIEIGLNASTTNFGFIEVKE